MVDQGVADPATVARRHLFGADIDPASVEACRRLLASWAGIEPSEVAALVSYLASDKAGAVTGASWNMDLGWTAQ